MITGRCVLGVYYCPYCGCVHGGVAIGGVYKSCDFFSFNNELCNAKQEAEDGEMPAKESMCNDCLLKTVQKLIGG